MYCELDTLNTYPLKSPQNFDSYLSIQTLALFNLTSKLFIFYTC